MAAERPRRITITHPYCWPYVRRGTERHIEGLARYLTRRGYEVTTVSSRPGPKAVEISDAGERVLHRQWAARPLSRLRIQPLHTFFLPCLLTLRSRQADIVHSFYYTDALAAITARGARRFRTVFQINGAPVPAGFHRLWPPERRLLAAAIRGVDQVVVCSEFSRQTVVEHYETEATVHVPPVDVDAFVLGRGPDDGRPVLLAVADFDLPRKGLRVLLQAFGAVHSRVPNVVLRLSGKLSAHTYDRLIAPLSGSLRGAVEVLGLGRPDDLPALYGGASVLVLPAMWEASGSVMFEAWSCGAAVAATRHGGLPEFVTPEVGRLFDPLTNGQETLNADGLTEAILGALEIAKQPQTRAACRRHAERYSWSALGPPLEALYAGLQ